METIDVFGFCKYRKKSAHVHVVAGKLPEEKTRNAIKRRKTNASKKQHKITEDTLFCAKFHCTVT